jgi:hypothetical protein
MDEPTSPQDRLVKLHLLKLPAIEVLHPEDEIPSTAVLLGFLAAFVEIAHVTDSVGGNHLDYKNCDCKGLIHRARRNAVFVFLGLFR